MDVNQAAPGTPGSENTAGAAPPFSKSPARWPTYGTAEAPQAVPGAGRLRLRTLVALRWLAVFGQTMAVLLVGIGFNFPLPLTLCLSVIAVSVIVNLYSMRKPARQRLQDSHAAYFLAFDILQLSVLLYLTGGLLNPFTLLFLGPVTVAATALPLRYVLTLGALGLVCITVLAFSHLPLPWNKPELNLPSLYIAGIWSAVVIGYGFLAAYVWRVSQETQRMSTALAATQAVLAREQRLSALGSLAAAAAHELGTPLATITLTAKELARELPPGTEIGDDVQLIRSQADRCREILQRLSKEQNAEDAMHARQALKPLLEEVAEPYRGFGVEVTTEITHAEDAPPPEIWRRPEIVHGLSNFVENAVDFARSHVVLEAESGTDVLIIRIMDDGPGFAPEIIQRLGEPYLTTRPRRTEAGAPDKADSLDGDIDPEGMGLGFFIASALLERTGGRISAENAGRLEGGLGGALITVRWKRERIEASPRRDERDERDDQATAGNA